MVESEAHEEGGTRRSRQGNIAITLTRDDQQAILSVRDDGIARGLGIGLAPVRGLVEAHGGEIAVVSDGPGHGSEFIVRLPVREAPTKTRTRVTPEAPTMESTARVLVVEDHADSRAMLAEMLGLEGHEVTAVASGAEAVQIAETSRFDVAIVDIGLRGMNGHEVARHLRSSLGDAIVLVAVTGYGQPEDIEQSRAAGFDAHVTKPVSADELLRVLRIRTRR